ncbi:MAG: GIY-YIG nuclease family protein [Saprospiraceae bacterium]|nr:GIY-YIG nuclease family protein [Saprospiraceae bacterium]
MYFVYVLYSRLHDRIYIGMTQNITHRLKEHNAGQNKSTKAFVPWEMVHVENMESAALAREKEIKLKSSSGRRFIRKNYLTIL